ECREIVRRYLEPVRHDQAILSKPCFVWPTLGLRRIFMLRKILTVWTNVSTAVAAVKGLSSAYATPKARSTGREKLVQRIGPAFPPRLGEKGVAHHGGSPSPPHPHPAGKARNHPRGGAGGVFHQ